MPAQRFGEAALNLAEVLQEGFHDDVHRVRLGLDALALVEPAQSRTCRTTSRRTGCRVRTCAASGTKFFDSNANGVRDDGEPGIPRFVIWADYDHDGVRDDNEPFSVSDNQGHYVIYDIRPSVQRSGRSS